jgi:hypothetical protein
MKKFLVPFLFVILFIIPFFWLSPGQMDIGGDASRLYFYDPLRYLQVQSLYGIQPSGIGGEAVSSWGIPYFLLLIVLKYIFQSPTILIDISHGVSLSVAFLAIYFIIKDIISDSKIEKSKYIELSAIISGIFYILAPTLILGWGKEILTHFQFFLNPLMFLLLFRFITRSDKKYLFASLIISFIFSANFSFVGAPDFFSFYPLAILFILLYTKIILKKKIPVKFLFLGLLLFILVQLFELGPQIISLLTPGAEINANVFSSQAKYDRGLGYFTGVAPFVKVSFSFLNLAQLYPLTWISYAFIIFPLLLLMGFLLEKNKKYLLTSLFFLITFFLVTANITIIGFSFYEKLFDIPGFSMFRNYFGQWVFVFTFFYTLLFGQSLKVIFQRLNIRYIAGLTCIMLFILVFEALPFLQSGLLNQILYQSNNVGITMKMDPEYEKVLNYIQNLPVDGKFISFPLTDYGYQIIAGTNGDAYQGPSTISYLAGKDDFTGDGDLTPFDTTFLTLAQDNNIAGINRLFSILNIKYVFYNSDPKVYDSNFPQYPYTQVRSALPDDQKGYQAFLSKLPIHKIKDFGPYYHIYEINNYLPHFYTADNTIYATDALSPFYILNLNKSLRTVVYTQTVPPQRDDVILTATFENPLEEILDNYHLHIAEPFISRRMDNIFYPFIVWREKESLKKLTSSPDDYVDYSLLYLAKRVNELQTFQQTPITHKPFHEPKLWQFNKWKDYYSWESNLSRIGTQTDTLVNWINSAGLSENMNYIERIKVNESLSGLQLSLINIVNNSSYSDDDKAYLLTMIKNLFNRLYQKVDLKPVNTTVLPYYLDMPQNLTGQYTPYLQGGQGMPLNTSGYMLKLNNVVSTAVSTNKKNNLIIFKPVNIGSQQSDIKLLYKPENLINLQSWSGLGSYRETPKQTIFAMDNPMSGGSGFSNKIIDYKPLTQYIITFDYYTQGDGVLFALYEKQNQNNQFSTETYFNKILSSSTWKTQQSIVTSSQFATGAYIQFTTMDNNYSGNLHIRNLSVIAIPDDTLLFRKARIYAVTHTPPNIQIKKINPTRYIIYVSQAVNPYTLVFSEAFSNNWRLYLPSNTPVQSNVIASYFNGEEKEEKMEHTFFNLSFLNNGTLLKPSLHTMVNGYANAWYITPADVGNKNDYYLTIIYQPETYFYYYLAISVLTFLVLVLLLIKYIIRRI